MAGLAPRVFLLLFLSFIAKGSVHDYAGESFAPTGNAFVFHGGSEGLYASLPNTSAAASVVAGDSFIRFEKISFTRPKEAAASSKDDDSSKVQAIVFEVEDRETIGGSAYGGQRAICCTPDLAKLGACNQGAVIYRPSVQNPDWPQVFSAPRLIRSKFNIHKSNMMHSAL